MKKISIITVVYNGEKYIEQALQSVLMQKLPEGWELEYVVIDGGSTDNTVEIIKKYEDKLAYFISEKDSGIYHAMNKGLRKATGEVVGILNSDDFYVSDDVLLDIINTFESGKCIDVVYGDLEYVNAENPDKVARYWKSREYENDLFKKGWHPPHPTLFVRGDIYEKCGGFDESFKIAADYDFMLRIFEKCKIKSKYINKTLVKMRAGGTSGKSIINILKANKECFSAWRKYEFSFFVSLIAVVNKMFKKIFQFFKRV